MYELPWDSVGHTVCFYGAFMVFLSFLELSTEDRNPCRFGTTWGWVNTDRISRFLVNCLFKVMSVCIPWALHVFSHFWQLVICHSENQLQLIVTSQAAAYKYKGTFSPWHCLPTVDVLSAPVFYFALVLWPEPVRNRSAVWVPQDSEADTWSQCWPPLLFSLPPSPPHPLFSLSQSDVAAVAAEDIAQPVGIFWDVPAEIFAPVALGQFGERAEAVEDVFIGGRLLFTALGLQSQVVQLVSMLSCEEVLKRPASRLAKTARFSGDSMSSECALCSRPRRLRSMLRMVAPAEVCRGSHRWGAAGVSRNSARTFAFHSAAWALNSPTC